MAAPEEFVNIFVGMNKDIPKTHKDRDKFYWEAMNMSISYDSEASSYTMSPENGTVKKFTLPNILTSSNGPSSTSNLLWKLSGTEDIIFNNDTTSDDTTEVMYLTENDGMIATTTASSGTLDAIISSQAGRELLIQFSYSKVLTEMNLPATISDHYPLGYAEVEQDLILFTHSNNAGVDCVWKISEDLTITLIYVHSNLGFNTNNLIKAVVYKETESLVKTYWVDGDNQPLRYLNLGRDNLWDTNETQTLACPYYIIDTPGIKEPIPGNLKFGTVQYCSYYYTPNGSRTRTSQLTYQATPLSSGKSGLPGERSSTGYKVDLNTDDRFPMIRVFRLHFTEPNGSPEIHMIYDGAVESTYQEFYDYGTASEISTASFADVFVNQPDVFKASDIEVIDNSIVLGGVIETPFNPDFDPRVYRYNTLQKAKILDISGNSSVIDASFEIGGLEVPTDHDCICPYNSILYTSDFDDYERQSDGSAYGASGVNFDVSFVADLRSTKEFSAEGGNNYQFRDYKCGEIYRFAVEIIDSYGRVSPAKWSCDLKMPEMNDANMALGISSGSTVDMRYSTGSTTTVNGLVIDNITGGTHISASNVYKIYPRFTATTAFRTWLTSNGYTWRISRAYRGSDRGTIIDQVIINPLVNMQANNAIQDYSNVYLPAYTIMYANILGTPGAGNMTTIYPMGGIYYNDVMDPNTDTYPLFQYPYEDTNFDQTTPYAQQATLSSASGSSEYVNYYSPKLMYSKELPTPTMHIKARHIMQIDVLDKGRTTKSHITDTGPNLPTDSIVTSMDARWGYTEDEVEIPTAGRRVKGYNRGWCTASQIFITKAFKSIELTGTTPVYVAIGGDNNEVYVFDRNDTDKVNIFKGNTSPAMYRNYGYYAYFLDPDPADVSSSAGFMSMQMYHVQCLAGFFNGASSKYPGFVWKTESGFTSTNTFQTVIRKNLFGLCVGDLRRGQSDSISGYPSTLDRFSYYSGPGYSARQNESYIPCTQFDSVSTTNKSTQVVRNGDIFRTTVPILRSYYRTDLSSQLITPQGSELDVTSKSMSSKEFIEVTMESLVNVDICPNNEIDDQFDKDNTNPDFYTHYNVYEREDVLFRNFPEKETTLTERKFLNQLYASYTSKADGESIDTFTIPSAIVNGKMDGDKGDITSIHNWRDNLVVVQEKAVSVYAINTKVQTATNAGSLGIGVGDFFYDRQYMSDEFGSRHRFGALVSNNAIYVVDDVNQKLIRIAGSTPQQLSDSQFGFNIMKEMIPNLIPTDNPYNGEGITMGYNRAKGLIYITAQSGVNQKTLSFSEATNSFVSYHNFDGHYPYLYAPHNRSLYIYTNEEDYESESWSLGEGKPLHYFHTEGRTDIIDVGQASAYLDVISSDQPRQAKQYYNILYLMETFKNGVDYPTGNIVSYRVYTDAQDTGTITTADAKFKYRKRFGKHRIQIARDVNSSTGLRRIHNQWAHVRLNFIFDSADDEYVYRLHFIEVRHSLSPN